MEAEVLQPTPYAFNTAETVATYDLDMEVWHPNRAKMASVVCEVLPFQNTTTLRFLDLGAGTGYLSHRVLERFPYATAIAVDAADLMLEKARARLQRYSERVTFRVATFQELPDKAGDLSGLDAVVSSLALHHLFEEEKLALFRYIRSILKPYGWFVNCDIIRTADAVLEARYRRLHHEGIRERMMRLRHQDVTLDGVSAVLTAKEQKDGDRPLLLADDLHFIKEAGFRTAECFWKEYREAVYGGIA